MGGCQSRNAVALNNLQTTPFDNDSEAGHGTNDFSLFLDAAAINRSSTFYLRPSVTLYPGGWPVVTAAQLSLTPLTML